MNFGFAILDFGLRRRKMNKSVWIGSHSGNNLKSKIRNLKFVLIGAVLFALCVPADAQQQAKVPRIGLLMSSGATAPY
jgi:hypothetical protein